MKAISFLALATTALSESTLTISNLCPFEIFYQLSSASGQGVAVPLSSAAKAFVPIQGSGNALKFSYPSQAQLQTPIAFDFSVSDFIYYDVSDVAGFPFALAACPSDPTATIVGCPANLAVAGSGGQSLVCDATRTAKVGSGFNVFACPQNFVGNLFTQGRPSVASLAGKKTGRMTRRERSLVGADNLLEEQAANQVLAKAVMEDMLRDMRQ